MRILIVEDNALLAMLMEDDLKSAGHETVGPVPSAKEAFEIAGDQQLDAAVVDIDLQDGRTGGQLASALHKRCVVVVFATGQPDLAARWSQHAIGVISKPVSTEMLHSVLDGIEDLKDGLQPSWPHGFRQF